MAVKEIEDMVTDEGESASVGKDAEHEPPTWKEIIEDKKIPRIESRVGISQIRVSGYKMSNNWHAERIKQVLADAKHAGRKHYPRFSAQEAGICAPIFDEGKVYWPMLPTKFLSMPIENVIEGYVGTCNCKGAALDILEKKDADDESMIEDPKSVIIMIDAGNALTNKKGVPQFQTKMEKSTATI